MQVCAITNRHLHPIGQVPKCGKASLHRHGDNGPNPVFCDHYVNALGFQPAEYGASLTAAANVGMLQ